MNNEKFDVILTIILIALALVGIFYTWSVEYQQSCFIRDLTPVT